MKLGYAALNAILGNVLQFIGALEVISMPSFSFCGLTFTDAAMLDSYQIHHTIFTE
jgi:hypothetical protein